eukprot:GFUD01069827.1.p1 GENE.GFUD01069827.1~~GFUD01069827.1.p1  ORF type:complete len:160 (-),score=47.24 GFUD01069827.1:128-607(-)
MYFGEDWLGWTIFVFIIVSIISIVFKVFIEYPGLAELKCIYELEEGMEDEMEDNKIKEKSDLHFESEKELVQKIINKKHFETNKNPPKYRENEIWNEEVSVILNDENHNENKEEENVHINKKVSFMLACEENMLDTKKTVAMIEHCKIGSSRHYIYRQC